MHTTRITLFGTFITTAVLLTAALATEEWHEQVLVKKLEQEQATGIGAIFPFKDRPLTRSLGTVYVLDAQPPFSEAFMESLEWIPWQEVQGALVSDITLQFDDDSGIVYFYDNNGEIFYQEDPDPNNPFDPLWINKLHGYGIVSRPISQYLLPSHVVGEYTLVVTEDAEEFRSGQMKMKLMKQPSATTSAPVPVDKKGIRFISMTTLANGFEFGFEVGECVAKAYHNHLTIKIEVLHSKDLTAPLESWTTLTNIPTPYISNPTESFFIPFTDVPGYVLNRPPLHDETCYTNAIVTTPSGQTITNAVYICGHPMTHPTEAGFFRLRIMDEGKEFGGITRVWLAEYSTPQQNLLAAFDADPSMAFANVFTDGNGGINTTGGLGWFDTGMTFQDFFFSNLDPRLPYGPLDPSERKDINFSIYGSYTAWRMTLKGMSSMDPNSYIISTSITNTTYRRTLSLRRGCSYEISLKWLESIKGQSSNPTYIYDRYNWRASVTDNLNFTTPSIPGVNTYNNYNPTRIPGVAVDVYGVDYLIANDDGLMTSHVYMNDHPNPNNVYGYGGGNVAEGLKAYLYLPKATFVTPAGDPANPAEMKDSGDGQNQFTFSTDNPGVLSITFKVKMEPSGAAARMAKYCKFTLDGIGTGANGSVMQWGPAHANGVPTAEGDYLIATVTFTGLPAYNNNFGPKTVKFHGCYDKVLATAQYRVFYPATGKNYPKVSALLPNASELTRTDIPNWFVYYRQNNSVTKTYTYVTNANHRSWCLSGQGNASIRIGNEAYAGDEYITTEILHGQLKATGVSGINKYYANFCGVLAHERQHAINEKPGGIRPDDRDGDDLTNNFEIQTSLTNPDNKNSAHPFITDDEVYAGGPVEENGIKAANTSQDWANPGTNTKQP